MSLPFAWLAVHYCKRGQEKARSLSVPSRPGCGRRLHTGEVWSTELCWEGKDGPEEVAKIRRAMAEAIGATVNSTSCHAHQPTKGLRLCVAVRTADRWLSVESPMDAGVAAGSLSLLCLQRKPGSPQSTLKPVSGQSSLPLSMELGLPRDSDAVNHCRKVPAIL